MAVKDLRVRDEQMPVKRAMPFLFLYTGTFLLGVALAGTGTLANAGWLHRGIQVGVGAVLAGLGLYFYRRARQRRERL
jgi:hypothetical protein